MNFFLSNFILLLLMLNVSIYCADDKNAQPSAQPAQTNTNTSKPTSLEANKTAAAETAVAKPPSVNDSQKAQTEPKPDIKPVQTAANNTKPKETGPQLVTSSSADKDLKVETKAEEKVTPKAEPQAITEKKPEVIPATEKKPDAAPVTEKPKEPAQKTAEEKKPEIKDDGTEKEDPEENPVDTEDGNPVDDGRLEGDEDEKTGKEPEKKEPEKPKEEKKEPEKPKQESRILEGDAEDSTTHVMTFFIVISVLLAVCYLAMHNKKKILGLLIEGRTTKTRRNVRYRRLSQNDDHESGTVIY